LPCQVYNDGAGCTAQRCTVACFFDEDCPAGSVGLSVGRLRDRRAPRLLRARDGPNHGRRALRTDGLPV